jgi:hypothetical protein
MIRAKSWAEALEMRSCPEPNTGCLLWLGAVRTNGREYGVIGSNRSGTRIMAHRAAWVVANGAIPDGMCVCHRCDTPACVNPEHLFLGTAGQNAEDRQAKGRTRIPKKKGESHPMAKLNAEQALYVRDCGLPAAVLSGRFGISQGTVRDIRRGTSWKSLSKGSR